MGIKLKIILGFALLTIVIVSSVSFWAAQSLGVSIDTSDIEKLTALRNHIEKQFASQYKELSKTGAKIAESFADLDMLARPKNEQIRFIEELKNVLNLDWVEIFINDVPVLNQHIKTVMPDLSLKFPVRLARSGPFSYYGYLVSKFELDDKTSVFVARKPDLTRFEVPMFCLFDTNGVLVQKNCSLSPEYLFEMAKEKVSRQITYNDDTYRIRVFEVDPGLYVLTGYAAQRAVISRKNVDNLMIRLTLLQVFGLLILGYFLGRRLFAPLQALGNGIEKVAQGDWNEIPLDAPPMADSGEEIESVARSFNKMVVELSSAQQRLIEVQKELAKKEKLAALGRFSAGIAHEINNPLGTILANAGLLKDIIEKGQKPDLEEIEEIISEVKRCKNIIGTLRTYTSKTSPTLEQKDIAKVFYLLAEKITNNKEFANIDIKLAHKASGLVMIDMSAMSQVFYNLAKNALEACVEAQIKDPHLIISSSSEKGHILISFVDNGPGFTCDPELIFEPLFTTKARGTGLGLIICQAIVEGHGGKIEASRKDGYTEMNVMLPFVRNKKEERD